MRKITRFAESKIEETQQEAQEEIQENAREEKKDPKEVAEELINNSQFKNTMKAKLKDSLPEFFESFFTSGNINMAEELQDTKKAAQHFQNSKDFKSLIEKSIQETVSQLGPSATASTRKMVKEANPTLIRLLLTYFLPDILSALGSVLQWLIVGGLGIWAASAISDHLGGADSKIIEPKTQGGKSEETKEWYSLDSISEFMEDTWKWISSPVESLKETGKDYVKENWRALIRHRLQVPNLALCHSDYRHLPIFHGQRQVIEVRN